MPRKRGNTNREKKSGRGSRTAQGRGSGSHVLHNVQNVHSSVHVHQHRSGENLEKDNMMMDKENAFQSLEEMFRETLDADVIHMVLAECDWKVDDALESLITLSGAEGKSSRSVQMEEERSTLSGIASSLFTYPSRVDEQNDLSSLSVRSRVGPQDEDLDVTDEEDHYDDFDLGTRDEMMLDQISDSIGISDVHRVVPPIRDFENSLEEIDDTPLLHRNQDNRPAWGEHQVTPDSPWNSKTNLPDLTCLYPGSIEDDETQASLVTDSSNKPNESPKGFAKSIQLAETYEKLAQSSNYYLYDFEEINMTSSYLNETESNPIDFELGSGGSPDLELYESGPFNDAHLHGPHYADLEEKLGNTIPKPLEFVSGAGACLSGCRVEPQSSVETIAGPTLEPDLYFNNSPVGVLEPALDAESLNAQTDDALRGVHGSLKSPDSDIVTASVLDDEKANLENGQKLRKNSESNSMDVGDDFEDILAAAAAAAEADAANGDDEGGDPSDDSETGKKFVHVYTYSSTSSSKEDSPEPLGGALEKRICRKKKKRSGGAIKAVYSGREEDFRGDADGLVNRMAGARDYLKSMNNVESVVKANSEMNMPANPERTVEVETLCQRMLGFRNVLKTQAEEKNDSDMLKTFDIDEMSDVKTLSYSDSESSDSGHRKTWPDILDLPNVSSKPIATISADIANRIPELEIMEYNLETIQESAEFSDGADEFGHEKGSIRRFITLDKIELPPQVQRQADLVAKKDDIQVNVKEMRKSDPGASCDENGDTTGVEDVVMAHEVLSGSSVQATLNLAEKAHAADISTDVQNIVRHLDETRSDVKSQSQMETLSAGSQCVEKHEMSETAIVDLMDKKTDDVEGVEDTIKLLLGIEPDDMQEGAKNNKKSLASSCSSGNASQEIMAGLYGADALKQIEQPVLSDTDPGAMIKRILGIEAASDTQSLSCDFNEMGDQGSNKKSDTARGDIGADSAIKKLLGIGVSDEENRTRITGGNVDQREDTLNSHDVSEADETVVLMKEGKVVESELKLSVDAKEFVPTGHPEHLHRVSAPGTFQLPDLNPPGSSDLPPTMPAFVTPEMNTDGTSGLPLGFLPFSYPFYPIADMTGFQQPFVPQPAFQSGVFYHSGENVVAQPKGRGRGKEKRGGRKSPFSKLAANFNQFSYTDLPPFMSVPPGFNHGARMPKTQPGLGHYKQQRSQPLDVESLENDQFSCDDVQLGQFEKTGQGIVRVSRNTQTDVSSKQLKIHSQPKPTNYTFHNSSYGKTNISEDGIVSEKFIGSEQGQIPSFAAMAAKTVQGTSNRQPQETNNRPRRSQELQANDKPRVQTVRRLLDRGDKVLIMMRGCPGSGKSTLARQLRFDGVILSTDDFFVSDDGRYLYEQEKLGDAHQWNQQRALKNMKDGVSPIIIDNTNIQAWEMKPYVSRGIERGYKVEIFEPNTLWQFKPGELARRNSHNVSKERIIGMIDRYDRNVTVEQIVGSSDKSRTRAVKQQANRQRTKETQPKRTRSEKKQPAQTATTKLQQKVTNRFALLGDEGKALDQDEVGVETASVTMQTPPMKPDGISADIKVDIIADNIEEESSGSQSGEISPDVVVESDKENSSDGEEVAAALNDAVMKNKEQLLDDFCALVDNFDVRDCLSDRDMANESSESDIELDDVRIRDDIQNTEANVETSEEAKVVLTTDKAVNEQVANVEHCVPSAGNDGLKTGEDVTTSSLDTDIVKLTPVHGGSGRELTNKGFSSPEVVLDIPPSTSQSAAQINLRKIVADKTDNVSLGCEPVPPGKRGPRIGWAGWGSSETRESGPTVSKHLKSSSGNEWTSSGENQPYFWSEAPGLVTDNRHADVPKPKLENILDLTHEAKCCVEVGMPVGENVWEEPKTRRERKHRNRQHDSPTSPSTVIDTEPKTETDSQMGDNRLETLACSLTIEQRHKDSKNPILLNTTDDTKLNVGNAESVELSEVHVSSNQTCGTVSDTLVTANGESPSVVSLSDSRCNSDSNDLSPHTPTISNEGQSHELLLVVAKEGYMKETDNTGSLQVRNSSDKVTETSDTFCSSETSACAETANFKTEMSDSVLNVQVSKEESKISDSIGQESESCDAIPVVDISNAGQGNEMVSISEIDTFPKVEKSVAVDNVCNADSCWNTDKSTTSETFKPERTAFKAESAASKSNEADFDIENNAPSDQHGGETEVATKADLDKESDSTVIATSIVELDNVGPTNCSVNVELAQETEEVGAVVEKSAIYFESDTDISATGPPDETQLPAIGSKEESLKSGSDLEAGGGTPTLLSLQDLCNDAVKVIPQQEGTSANKIPDTTPSRKTKSQKSKLTPKQKFVQGIKEDIVAIGKSLPQDWTLPDFLVNPSSVKFEVKSLQADTSNKDQDMREFTDSGTYTSSHDFVLLYKVQKNLPYNLSDIKVIEYNTKMDLSGSTAESTSLSTSAPRSPKKRKPFLLDKSCSTDEVCIPLSVEADLIFLKSCFPTVSEGDLKHVLEDCGQDVEWAVNLLLDSGYEYNCPKTTKERAKSQGRDDDKDVDTAQENTSAVQSPERSYVKIEGEHLDSKADGQHLASPDAQSCDQPNGLAALSRNVLTDSNWLNSWGSLGGYDLPMQMIGDYHFDVSDLPFEQTALPYQQRTQHLENEPHDLDAIDNVEIRTTPQADIGSNHFGLIPSSERSISPTFEFSTTTAHDKANAQPPLQSSTPVRGANKYQRIIDTVRGVSTAPHIEPIVYMPIPGIRKLNTTYDYADQRKESRSDLSSSIVDASKSLDTSASPDDTNDEMTQEWSSEDCGLSMELSPAMARGLQELFGPVGFHVNAESLCPDDLKINLSYNIARLLHEAWANTLEKKMVKEENAIEQLLKSDKQLAQQLQSEEDAMHHVTKVITMPPRKVSASGHLSPLRSRSPKGGQSPKTHRNYTDAPSSGITFKEEFPNLHPRSSSPSTSLQQIMEEELAIKRKREQEEEKLASSASHLTMAIRMKRQKLYELFPGLQESVLDEIFESCGFALGPTVSAIRGSTEENPQSVFTSSNLSDYEEILVREAEVESKNTKYLGGDKSSADYQTFEDRDYQDYRAEATLHYNIRHECFQKAQEAHRRGMKQVATFYSQQGHMHTEKIRAANKRASERILEHRSSKLQQSNTLDLHGLHVSEAIEALEDLLTQRQNENAERPDKRKLHLYVVTGRGVHSKSGIAKIKPAIVSYLNRNGYRYSEPQLGMLRVNVNQFAQ